MVHQIILAILGLGFIGLGFWSKAKNLSPREWFKNPWFIVGVIMLAVAVIISCLMLSSR